jgi:hypothetical protein
MKDHEKDDKSHVFEHHNLPGHEIDFENVEILDRADTKKKNLNSKKCYILENSNPLLINNSKPNSLR